MSELYEADLTWTGASFERGVRVRVDEVGRIEEVGADLAGTPRVLSRRALLPGFVDAHSHAFQRGLRGRGETFPRGAGSFWTWREAMYGLVAEMDAEQLFALSLSAFREMLAAGITSVGEFHYLHHDASGVGYSLDAAVLAAAREAGIRIVFLSVYYAQGGIDAPLEGAQLRFRSRSPAEYWDAFDRLYEQLDPRTQSLGAVVHSIRAASLEDLTAVHAEARRRGLVFHMHVEEQKKEIEDCVAAHGRTPMRVLLDELEVDGGFTAVHATHTTSADADDFLATGATVCVCPLTEANLGDGIPALGTLSGGLALGTDSNAVISMSEEMRLLEYAQRIGREQRGALRDESGRVGPRLLAAATAGGARSLGLDAGAIRAGAEADFLTLDLDAPALAGWQDDTLLPSWIYGAGDRALAEVCVGGRWLGA